MAAALAAALVGLGLLALAIRNTCAPSCVASSETTAQVTVDFSRPLPTSGSMLGFLHSLGKNSPDGRWIAPLDPAVWRGNPLSASYERATGFGARYVLVVSDLWGYPGAGWYGRQPPWEHPGQWFVFVRNLALAYRNRPLVWDIWNEPNVQYFWNGTQAQYYQTYGIAQAAIRSVLGSSAVFAGPSVDGFRWSWLYGLLDYCRQQRCRVDILTWAELQPAGINFISDHVGQARQRLLANRSLAPTGVRSIYVNEYLAQSDALYPGSLVAYLDELERGGADTASMACWPYTRGATTCNEQTLDGLLAPGSLRPRGVWWTARAYAEGVGSRVTVSSSAAGVATIAAARSPDQSHAQVLIGYFDTHRPLSRSVGIRVVLRGLAALPFLRTARKLRVSLQRLLATASPSDPQPIGIPQDVPVSRGTATIVVPPIAVHDAVVVRLSAADR